MERMKGKYAVITGGNSGIGEATARMFVKEGAAGVAILDIDKKDGKFQELAKELAKSGIKAFAIPCDVSNPDIVRDAFAQIDKEFPRIDALVNSAGILDNNSSVLWASEELWDRVVAINQSGVFYCCREALKRMLKQGENGEGAIVNVSSVAGVSGNAGAAYSASKHAVIGLAKNIAIQYSGTGIRCNAICPGPTATPMGFLREDQKRPDGLPNDPNFDLEFKFSCDRHTDVSVGPCEPDDQAHAILFFCSDEAKSITGQWIQVDKGFY